MKINLMTRIIGGLVVASLVAGSVWYYNHTEKIARENATRIVLDISGMTCDSCSNKIKGSLSKIKGVYTTEIDLDSNTGAIEFNQKKISKTDITKAVRDIGYPAQIKKDSSRLQVIDYNIKFN